MWVKYLKMVIQELLKIKENETSVVFPAFKHILKCNIVNDILFFN